METINAFVHSGSFLKNLTQFQAKMERVHTRFQTKTAQKRISRAAYFLV